MASSIASFSFSEDSSPSSQEASTQDSNRAYSINCGMGCHRCHNIGKVGIDPETREPFLTKPLFIVPNCGHSVCETCRTRMVEEGFCRVCRPYETTSPIPNITGSPLDSTDSKVVNATLAGLTVLNKSGLEQVTVRDFGVRVKKSTIRHQGENAMFASSCSKRGPDHFSLPCTYCSKVTASAVCDHCYTLTCATCFVSSHSDDNQHHQAISVLPTTPISTCGLHNKPNQGFCVTCDLGLCLDCVFQLLRKEGPHLGHEVNQDEVKNGPDASLVIERGERFCLELERSSSLVEKLATRFESTIETKSKELDMQYMRLFAVLQLKLKEQQSLLKSYAQQKLQDIRKNQETLRNLTSYVKDLINCTEDPHVNQPEIPGYLLKLNAITAVPSILTAVSQTLDDLDVFVSVPDLTSAITQIENIELYPDSVLVPLYKHEISQLEVKERKLNVDKLFEMRNELPDVKSTDGLSLDGSAMSKCSNMLLNRTVEAGDLIKVCHIVNPLNFYFLFADSEKDLAIIKNRIQKLIQDPRSNLLTVRNLESIAVGTFVLARFFADKCWYRARIDQIKESPKSKDEPVIVFFIDYGNKARSSLEHIKIPSRQYMLHSAPPFAVHAKLFNVTARTQIGETEPKFSTEVNLKFKMLVEERLLKVAQVKADSDLESGQYCLDVYETSCGFSLSQKFELYNDYPASITDALVFSKLARYKESPVEKPRNLMVPKNPFHLETESLERSKRLQRCAVTEVVNPWKFFCRLAENRHVYEQERLLSSIEQYISKFNSHIQCQVFYPYQGMYCLAEFEVGGSVGFYRAIVVMSKLLSREILVFFVDFGNTAKVNLSQLRKIPLQFLNDFPSVLFECRLNGARPINGKSDWDERAVEETKKFILNRYVNLKVVSESNHVFTVDVSVLPNNDDGLSQNLLEQLSMSCVAEKELVPSGSLECLQEAENDENLSTELQANVPSIYSCMQRILVSFIESPWNICFRFADPDNSDPIDNLNAGVSKLHLDGLLKPLHEESTSLLEKDEIFLVVANVAVAENDVPLFHRCKILRKIDNDIYEVRLIDQGMSKTVTKSQLYICVDDNPLMSSEPLAYRCVLEAISPAGSSNGQWSRYSVEVLERLVSENELFVNASEKQNRVIVNGESCFDHVDFKEIYHVDPLVKKLSNKTKADYVHVSYYLKNTGCAIPNKEGRSAIVRAEKSNPVNEHLKPAVETSNSTVTSVNSRSHSSCSENLVEVSELKGNGKDKQKILEGETESESDDDENEASMQPTVIFLPLSKRKTKPSPTTVTKPLQEGAQKGEKICVTDIDRDFLDNLCPKVETSFCDVPRTPEVVKRETVQRNSNRIIFNEHSFSPASAEKSDQLGPPSLEFDISKTYLWNFECRADNVIGESFDNPTFDLTDHEIAEFKDIDDIGDADYKVLIKKHCFYPRLEVPKVAMLRVQFEDFSTSGVTLFGVFENINKDLKTRINLEVDSFVAGRYIGMGFSDEELYLNMAACVFFSDDNKWYRGILLNKSEQGYMVRFADFGNKKTVARNDFLPLAAFPAVPALHAAFKVQAVTFADDQLDPTENKLYARKLLATILNDQHHVFVGIKGEVRDEGEDRLLISVYSDAFHDLRHFLVDEDYLKWDIAKHELLDSQVEFEFYEMVVKSTVPFNLSYYERHIGQNVEIELLYRISNKFVFGRILDSHEISQFDAFMSKLNTRVNQEDGRIQDVVGQLVYVYDRSLRNPLVWHRGQVMGVSSDEENRRIFNTFLLDYGCCQKIPQAVSLRRVHNLDTFISRAADAVPFIFTSSNSNMGEKASEKNCIVRGKVISVGEVVVIDI